MQAQLHSKRAFGGHNPHGGDPSNAAKEEYPLHADHHKTHIPKEDLIYKEKTKAPKLDEIPSDKITIPEYDLQFTATTSGGPGGQNANKVATCVEVRFNLDKAWWIEEEVKERLREQQAGRINKEGEFFITSQVGRTQQGNRRDALSKLQQIVDQAAVKPRVHIPWASVSKEGLEHRKLFKQARKNTKNMRGPINY
jgi:protein subunit release factor B